MQYELFVVTVDYLGLVASFVLILWDAHGECTKRHAYGKPRHSVSA